VAQSWLFSNSGIVGNAVERGLGVEGPDSQISSSAGIFGNYWRSTYEESVFYGDDGYMKYSRADGTAIGD